MKESILSKPQTMNKYLVLLALVLLSACYRVPNKIEPELSYSAQEGYIKSLPSGFRPLSSTEKKEEWGKEYQIALAMAKKLDLYRAISNFKRAEVLVPTGKYKRLREIQYYIMYCYYLGKRYGEVIQEFNESLLKDADKTFPAYHDLLIILYESYLEEKDPEKAEYILKVIEVDYPETAKNLKISTALVLGNIPEIKEYAANHPSHQDLKELTELYEQQKKSVGRAQVLNAIIPGSGYLYVGQRQSAVTSFLLNGLFIAAAYHFFHKGNVAAGIITTSFETGWYFGGIYGAGEAAKLYNERIYEENAYKVLKGNEQFPVLMLNYGF